MSFSTQSYQVIFVLFMSVIFLLIIISISVASVFLVGFIWAVKNGQYEDDYSPSVRMLFDDERLIKKKDTELDTQKEKTNLNKTQPQA